MSTPNELPDPEQQSSQPPPGYQQPGAPQYQPPSTPSGDFKFEIPQDMPHSVREVMPVGGFAGILKMDGLPQMLKLSYIMWLVAAGIWVLTTLVLLLGSDGALCHCAPEHCHDVLWRRRRLVGRCGNGFDVAARIHGMVEFPLWERTPLRSWKP